jgi:hypothetical protein
VVPHRPLERYGLKWLHITFRGKEFDREILQNVEGADKGGSVITSALEQKGIQSLTAFLNIFMLYYNHLRWHQGVKTIPGGEVI